MSRQDEARGAGAGACSPAPAPGGGAPAGPHLRGWRLCLTLALLATTSFVDAVGLLGFGLFPSFFSGDTTQFGVALAQGRDARAAVLGGAAIVFVAGAFLGRLLRLGAGRGSAVLVVEALLLATAASAARLHAEVAALALAVLAMGAQATATAHAGAASLGTDYATGVLARLGSGLADAMAGEHGGEWPVHLLLWTALAVGAAGGAACYGRAGLESLALAAAACAVLAVAAGVGERRIGERRRAR